MVLCIFVSALTLLLCNGVCLASECGHVELTELTGFITSPNYTILAKYPPRLDCTWYRSGNHTLLTQVKILELDVEPGPNNSNLSCDYDHLLVKFDSSRNRNGQKFCGNFAPHEVYQGQGNFTVKFFSDDSYRCRGFKLQYNFTTNFTRCTPDPCLNGGVCEENVYGFYCVCEPHYDGRRCEREIPPCESGPCLNGAACVDHMPTRTYTCNCTRDWGGPTCEKEMGCANPGLEGGKTKYYNGETIQFGCDPGYYVFGTTAMTCGWDNKWTHDHLPTCKVILKRKQWTKELTIIISTLTACMVFAFVVFFFILYYQTPEEECDELSTISHVTSQYSWPSNLAVYNFDIH